MVFSRKYFYTLGGFILAVQLQASAANVNCVACALAARQNSVQSTLGQNTSTLGLGIDITNFFSPSHLANSASPIQYTLPPNTLLSKTSSDKPIWDGVGELPNAFVRPWEMPKTNFDPSFITPFYTEATGPV